MHSYSPNTEYTTLAYSGEGRHRQSRRVKPEQIKFSRTSYVTGGPSPAITRNGASQLGLSSEKCSNCAVVGISLRKLFFWL
ncbi:hypothetical protein M378DRAFT_171056, partial [Amanita muscaria Koide BX008]